MQQAGEDGMLGRSWRHVQQTLGLAEYYLARKEGIS